MSEDPLLKKKLDDEARRQDEYLKRRVEAGDLSANRRREEGAAEAAEATVTPDPAPPAPAEGGAFSFLSRKHGHLCERHVTGEYGNLRDRPPDSL